MFKLLPLRYFCHYWKTALLSFKKFPFFSLICPATFLYILSINIKCPYELPERCINWLFHERGLIYILVTGLTSNFLLLFTGVRLFYSDQKCSFKYFALFVYSLDIVFLLQLETGQNFYHHGSINGLVLMLLLFITLMFCLLNKIRSILFTQISVKFGLEKMSPQERRPYKIALSLIICLLIVLFLTSRNSAARNDFWLVPNSEIDPSFLSEGTCSFRNPKVHMFDLLSGFLNVARFWPCSGNDLSWIPKSLRNYQLLAFPRYSYVDMATAIDYKKLMKYSIGNVVGINSKDVNVHELVLNVDMPRLGVKVVRNETLAKSRKIRTKELSFNVSSMNDVLILFVDALSRRQLRRKLPETFKFLESVNSKQHDAFDDSFNGMGVRSYLKFHSIKTFTPPNIFPLLYGKEEKIFRGRRKTNPAESLFDLLPRFGYVTGYGVTACQVTDFDWGPYNNNSLIPYDHRLAFCDPNVFNTDEPYSNLKGPFSILKRCLYGRYLHEYAFDYINSFWAQYFDMPKLFMLHFSEAHEGTAEVVQYMDLHLKTFLQDFIASSESKKTSIFLLSDHGNHMNFILRESDAEAYKTEVTAPLLNIIGNHDVMDEDLSATNHNAYALISMYDIHKTISQLIFRGIEKSTSNRSVIKTAGNFLGKQNLAGIDILRQKLSFRRNCRDARIASNQCSCLENDN